MNGCIAIERNAKKLIEDSFKAFMAKHFSRGPGLAKVFVASNCITIYCKDILTTLEKNLADVERGEQLVKLSREKIIRNNEAEFMNIINDNVKADVDSYYIDFDIKDNSLACVFIVNSI